MKSLTALTLSFGLLVAAAAPAGADMHEGDHASLEQMVIQMAETPEQHRALADYYREKAEQMRGKAAEHRSMGKTYTGTKLTQRQRMRKHCNDLASSFENAAGGYEALAKEHAEAARP